MRKYKFRAWDGNKIFEVGMLELQVDRVWEYYNFHDNYGGEHTNYGKNEIGVLMQYTGLRDKNGVEIYEGDIVEHRNDIKELLGIYEVKWGLFGFTLFDKIKPELSTSYITPTQLEVIGNIYENPELLTNL